MDDFNYKQSVILKDQPTGQYREEDFYTCIDSGGEFQDEGDMVGWDEKNQTPIYATKKIIIPPTFANVTKQYEVVKPALEGLDKYELIKNKFSEIHSLSQMFDFDN